MNQRQLGRDGPWVCPMGFGAFKIGRNEKIKYPQAYDLPSDDAVQRLVDGLLDLGVNLFDTAPAYGLSEERLGRCLRGRRERCVLCTKVGETFANGESTYDFRPEAVRASVERSLRRLGTDHVDSLLLHSPGNDLDILRNSGAVDALLDLKARGLARRVGLSGKTVEGAMEALAWADVLMVEYHLEDRSHEPAMDLAFKRGVGVIVKKALRSGSLPAAEALRFALGHPAVAAVVVGTLNLEHMRANLAAVAPFRC